MTLRKLLFRLTRNLKILNKILKIKLKVMKASN